MQAILIPSGPGILFGTDVFVQTVDQYREAVQLAIITFAADYTVEAGHDATTTSIRPSAAPYYPYLRVYTGHESEVTADDVAAIRAEFAPRIPAYVESGIIEANAAQSAFYAVNDPTAPARPDWDDLTPAERLQHAMYCEGTCEFGEEAHGGPEASA